MYLQLVEQVGRSHREDDNRAKTYVKNEYYPVKLPLTEYNPHSRY